MTLQPNWTTPEVIGMFEGLGLPVTDDGRQIDEKSKKLYSRYLRKKNSAQPAERHEGEVWFKNLDAMQNHRSELLAVMRNHFNHWADAVFDAAGVAGSLRSTDELQDQLMQYAREECRCEETLAQRFVEDYLETINVIDIINPRLVANFNVVSSVGQITLSWRLPDKKCDEVIVRRYGTTKKGGFQKAGIELARGSLSDYQDRAIEPGQRYLYRIFSVYNNQESASSVDREIIAIGEITNFAIGWDRDHVRLSWQSPVPHCEVFVFRAESAITPDKSSWAEPQPTDPKARLIYRDKDGSFEDRDTLPGHEYYYWATAFFEPGAYSPGISKPFSTPVAPHPPLWAKASYHCDRAVDQSETGVKDQVEIEWEPGDTRQKVGYLVVRREGGVPPRHPQDGDEVGDTAGTGCRDGNVEPGHRYVYAVFAYTTEMFSLRGTATDPVDVLAEVANLRARTGDRTVELLWDTPPNTRVIVRRGDVEPRDHQDGDPVSLAGLGYARDEGLTNGALYYYRVCCAYRPVPAEEVVSPGVLIPVTPNPLPVATFDFKVEIVGLEVVCTWTPPPHGQVAVIRSSVPPDHLFDKQDRSPVFRPGDRLPASALDLLVSHSPAADDHQPDEDRHVLGQRIPSEIDCARDVHPNIDQPYYYSFSVLDPHAIACGYGVAAVCPDVTDLKLDRTNNGVILHWVWPPRCTEVRVVRRAETPPDGPDDPQADSFAVTLNEYRSAGERYVDTPPQAGHQQLFYALYAVCAGGPEKFLSPGTDLACRGNIPWGPWMTLQYAWVFPKKKGKSGDEVGLRWQIDSPLPNFAGFMLIACESQPPQSPQDGIELFRWVPLDGLKTGDYEAVVSLAPIRRKRWSQFFCKMFTIDPLERHALLIIHPNACLSISDQGQLMVTPKAPPTSYRPGVPKTVICPTCFEEFPVNKMLFGSFAGGNTQPARYTALDRALGHPLNIPVTKRGEKLARKLCPNKHILPFTAGTQKSLIIGMIGAKFSGKSHYIAALVERLRTQVAGDFQGDLTPATTETINRYDTEFHQRLFEDRLELAMTPEKSPPLIYDLQLSGALWGEDRPRSVTLALYDTAGENFDNEDTVRQMVQYLRHAAGIIFLIDPLQSPEVRDRLPSTIPLPDFERMAEPAVVIHRVLTELEQSRIVAQAGPLSTPVAVVLTKCDVLRDTGLIASNRLWSTDERHIGFFDTRAHDDMTGMMGEYVRHWSPAAYNTVYARFSHHAFFGVSATGCASDKQTHRYKFIAPWRVEDPLLWLLAELGVIPSR
jgi:hypothetical protein